MTSPYRFAFLAAPLLTFTYGVIRILDGLDGTRGPGPAWTTGHLAFIAAMAMFVSVFVQLRRLAGGNLLSTVIMWVAITGALALTGQFTVDIVAGFAADDHYAMSMITKEVHSIPVISLAIYDVGPYLFYLGQLALIIQLAVMRRVKVWTPVLVMTDLMMPFIDKDLIPLGAIVLFISFAPLARRPRNSALLPPSSPLRDSPGFIAA
ncbi:hypothetical protein ABZ815_30015 [Nonomuraea sp. NPDC047529]|uniref:hypothetical protein n=1 Tax=Nonomuraea sp. NPDC047529 TaxID=3155623 RepID=UPI0033C6DA0C